MMTPTNITSVILVDVTRQQRRKALLLWPSFLGRFRIEKLVWAFSLHRGISRGLFLLRLPAECRGGAAFSPPQSPNYFFSRRSMLSSISGILPAAGKVAWLRNEGKAGCRRIIIVNIDNDDDKRKKLNHHQRPHLVSSA